MKTLLAVTALLLPIITLVAIIETADVQIEYKTTTFTIINKYKEQKNSFFTGTEYIYYFLFNETIEHMTNRAEYYKYEIGDEYNITEKRVTDVIFIWETWAEGKNAK